MKISRDAVTHVYHYDYINNIDYYHYNYYHYYCYNGCLCGNIYKYKTLPEGRYCGLSQEQGQIQKQIQGQIQA